MNPTVDSVSGGGAFTQMDIQPPLRTRSTPPTADTFQQPRFTPHKSNGPTMAPGYSTVPQQGQQQQQKFAYTPFYGVPDMYGGYAMGHSGFMHNTYLQQQQAQRTPVHQPIKRASKALQIVDPSTGKPIVIDGPPTPKPETITAVPVKTPRQNWSQTSPINSALVLSCSNSNNVKTPLTPVYSSRSSAGSELPPHAAVDQAVEQQAKDSSKSLKRINIPQEAVQMQNASAPIDSSSVKASSQKQQPHASFAINVKKDTPSAGRALPLFGSVEEHNDTISKAPELPASSSVNSTQQSIVVSSPSQSDAPNTSSSKNSISSPVLKGAGSNAINSIPEISLNSLSPHPTTKAFAKKEPSLSKPWRGSAPTSPNLSDSSSTKDLRMHEELVELPRRCYTTEEILLLEFSFDAGLPDGIALDSSCLKQNPNTNSGRSAFHGARGGESSRRIPRSGATAFRTSSGEFQNDSGNHRRLSLREDGNERSKHDRNHTSRRSSQRGSCKEIFRHEEPAVAPLEKSETRWVPRQKIADEEEILKRKIKAVLNKLTLDKFETLSKQFLDLVQERVSTIDHLKTVVELIFDKALSEPTFVKMYSSLCVAIAESMPEFQTDDGGKGAASSVDRHAQTFKRLLLHQCQQEFERGTSFDVEPNLDVGEREESVRQQKRRFLGNVHFIGELFKDSMLAERIMHTCIYHFLQEAVQPMEEDIEALCKLLSTIGKKFDRLQAKNHIDSYFHRMQLMSTNMALSRRARFMLLDVIDLRKSGWKPRRKEVEAKTIDEFRQEMEREVAEQNARSARSGSRFDSLISRGSSLKTGLK